jgi:hypothetical protein
VPDDHIAKSSTIAQSLASLIATCQPQDAAGWTTYDMPLSRRHELGTRLHIPEFDAIRPFSALISCNATFLYHQLAYRRWLNISLSLSSPRCVWHLYAPLAFVQQMYNDRPKVSEEREVIGTYQIGAKFPSVTYLCKRWTLVT